MWPQKLAYNRTTDDSSYQTVARRSYSKLSNVESGILYAFTFCPKANCVFDSLHITSEQGLYLTVDKLGPTCTLIPRSSIEGLSFISTNTVFLHDILYQQ